MKSLLSYIKEDSESKNEEDKTKELRRNIKFTIWKEPKTKVKWLEEGDYKYQKIEYQYVNKEKGVNIDFLLGYVPEEKTWKLWIGKLGATTYDDDPWCDFKEQTFAKAIIAALDKVEEFVDDVENGDPDNWVQFYKVK